MSDHLTRISLQSCNYYDEKFATAETNKIPGYRWFFGNNRKKFTILYFEAEMVQIIFRPD